MSDLLDVRPLRAGDRERLEAIASAHGEAVDAKGGYVPSHTQGVARLAQVIGAYLGIEGDALFRLRLAGLMHDAGKLRVPDHVLLKTTPLTESDWTSIKGHPHDGHALLVALGLYDEARWVLHHHERGDGTGYPSGLAGESIPFGSRILLVADAYHVMVSGRSYSAAMTPGQAIRELRDNAPGQFDPAIVEALASALLRGHMIRDTAGRARR